MSICQLEKVDKLVKEAKGIKPTPPVDFTLKGGPGPKHASSGDDGVPLPQNIFEAFKPEGVK